MTRIIWSIPTRGDGPRARGWEPAPALPATVRDGRVGGPAFTPFDYLHQISRAAELGGLAGVYVPYDPLGEESLVVSGSLGRDSRHLEVVAGFAAGIATPVYAAKLSATLQRAFGGRLAWRLAVDLDERLQRTQGDFVTGTDRYARAAEFLTVAKAVWHGQDVDYTGRFYEVVKGGFTGPLAGLPFPTVYLSGTSDEALALSAEHADVHVFDLAPDDELDRHLAKLDGRVRRALQATVHTREEESELSGAPGLRGTYEQVADQVLAYRDRGFDTFFLAADPRLEEVLRIAQHVRPLLVGRA
ncbi:LLM class flavin-dependent oxidoreductase [Actinosynnema sp. NPDC047251]|uniref:Alkanesulfonate monooxygenase n=1 Tax=Saccharothrix espanaensis (strain ATCC 51144 / DSM 44229 / JCM 9112 / NBRC 15066 / NRRL 15764) TaxID=1179773 RepID=K0K571_SACES|nr:LLM class flavin-dependent oxidoreductase [Saccharothrix espanaensis]CCH31673.1 Alkanesulfonate monooxygenase [Saccharothrix espanaensis DSM 44229]